MHLQRSASLSVLLATTASLALAACGGSDGTAPQQTGCGTVPLGIVTAVVDGQPFTGTLSAQATIQNSAANGPNVLQVNGVECPNGAQPGRQILITIGRIAPITAGTYQLSAASQLQPPGSGYTGIGQYLRAPSVWTASSSDAVGPGSGTITFTTVSATRLTGTFQMVAVAVPGNAANAQQRVTITNGSFDVPRP